MSRTTRAMAETTALVDDMSLTKTPQQIADSASEWVGALAAFVTAARRVRNYTAETDRNKQGAKIVKKAIDASATTLEEMASREGQFVLNDLDLIVRTLDTQHPTYKRLEALRNELYRLMSEAKVETAASLV